MVTIEKKPKVSVCVMTYNQEKYIRQCLQSIVDQETDFEFEVIVSDDCSTDGTSEILLDFAEKYPKLVKLHLHPVNMGAYSNYIELHSRALGELVSHCDGDDLFLPSKLQKQVNFFAKNTECTVSWHRMNLFDDFGGFCSGMNFDYSMFPNGIVTFEKALRLGAIAIHSSIMYRRCARKTTNPTFKVIDLFYAWEFLSEGSGVILDEVLGAYRVNAKGAVSKSANYNIKLIYFHHARFYFQKYPSKRKDILFFALTNFLADLKNGRKTAIYFFILVIQAFSLFNLREFKNHLIEVRKLRMPKLI